MCTTHTHTHTHNTHTHIHTHTHHPAFEGATVQYNHSGTVAYARYKAGHDKLLIVDGTDFTPIHTDKRMRAIRGLALDDMDERVAVLECGGCNTLLCSDVRCRVYSIGHRKRQWNEEGELSSTEEDEDEYGIAGASGSTGADLMDSDSSSDSDEGDSHYSDSDSDDYSYY
jgi:hypothetical protein